MLADETVVAVQSGFRMQVGLSSLLRLFALAHELVWDRVFERIAAATQDKRELATASTLRSPGPVGLTTT